MLTALLATLSEITILQYNFYASHDQIACHRRPRFQRRCLCSCGQARDDICPEQRFRE